MYILLIPLVSSIILIGFTVFLHYSPHWIFTTLFTPAFVVLHACQCELSTRTVCRFAASLATTTDETEYLTWNNELSFSEIKWLECRFSQPKQALEVMTWQQTSTELVDSEHVHSETWTQPLQEAGCLALGCMSLATCIFLVKMVVCMLFNASSHLCPSSDVT